MQATSPTGSTRRSCAFLCFGRVAGRKPSEAANNFLTPIQEALGCFLDGRVSVTTYDGHVPGVLTLNGGAPTPIIGSSKLTVQISIRYTIVETEDPDRGPWKVNTDAWIHSLFEDEIETLGYHWHPVDTPDVLLPHLHYRKGREHLPTGRVLVEDLLRAAVEHGAKPRDAVRWEQIERDNREAFKRGATWGAGPV